MQWSSLPVGLSVAMIALAAVPAQAVTVQVDTFAIGDLAGARSARDAFLSGAASVVSEGFESFAAWDGTSGTPTPIDTGVGLFRSDAPPPGSGGSSVGGGTTGEIRADGPMFGRQNLTDGGANWLDSNDLETLVWEVGGAGTFKSLSFFLTDVGDIAGTDFNFSVTAGSESATTHIPRQASGTINFVRILFDAPVTTALVTFNTQHNDGFGLDDATAAAPIPLPGAGLLLLGGLAGFAALRRRGQTVA